MNKKLNKITVIILSIFMCCSFIFGVAYKFDWDSFTAKAENLEKRLKRTKLQLLPYRNITCIKDKCAGLSPTSQDLASLAVKFEM